MKRRESMQRQAILAVLQDTREHPTADGIYDEVRKTIPAVSKGTVYRNLGVLQEMGLVTELHMDGMANRYEASIDGHYHFRCRHCGTVIDLPVPVDAELDRRVAAATGLTVTSHRLEFHGLCPACQQQQKNKEEHQ